MTPPVAPVICNSSSITESPQAVFSHPEVMRKRADFLRASRALRQAAPGFHLQARKRAPDEPFAGVRVGYTCSKKVGNAVARNRAKRRLREIARLCLPEHGQDGWDYVLVGKVGATAARPFTELQSDLITALARVHQK